MRYIMFVLLGIGFVGCSGEQVAHNITKTQIAMSGNKPPVYFDIANVETMRDYVFNTKDFSFSLPNAKQKDFSVMGGWFGSSNRDGRTVALNLNHRDIGINYHIVVLASKTSKYTERERELESGNTAYIRGRKKWLKNTDKLLIRRLGKENYPCIVVERVTNKRGIRKKIVSCYKFNPTKTKVKHVTISLTYTKVPTLPAKYKYLAREYTYQDLQRRAKRVLDSLYIKDGW